MTNFCHLMMLPFILRSLYGCSGCSERLRCCWKLAPAGSWPPSKLELPSSLQHMLEHFSNSGELHATDACELQGEFSRLYVATTFLRSHHLEGITQWGKALLQMAKAGPQDSPDAP